MARSGSKDADIFKSYSSLSKTGLNTLTEFRDVYRHKTSDISGTVAKVVETCEEMERISAAEYGRRLVDMDVLEVGAGQQMLRLKYFGRRNRVVSLDYDVIIQGFTLSEYWRSLRRNGARRTLKTLLRKLSGIDRAYLNNLSERIGAIPKRMDIVQGDAHDMPWPDCSFDFIYSFSVFEHLQDPTKCLAEVVRLLRPGGILFISTHLYTSNNGAHDPRTFIDRHQIPPVWAHLREAYSDSVRPNAYCNKWSMQQWLSLFSSYCPDVSLIPQASEDWLREELVPLRSAGELADYSDAELLTTDLWAVWQKPDMD